MLEAGDITDVLLTVRDLHVQFTLREGTVRAVNGVDLTIRRNRTLGIVGESGCGKSITAKAIMGILPKKAAIAEGQIKLASRTPGQPDIDITALAADGRAMRRIRGSDIAMVFQEPMTSFSPVHTIGNQIVEAVLLHRKCSGKEARELAIEMLRLVQVPLAERRVDAYPHELSGGLRQRCMIAMALCCRPRLLIADEPTTALDVTIQAQILDLLRKLQNELEMAVVMITHDLGVIAQIAQDVAVMYLGRIVETASVTDLFDFPKHPYTQGLLASVPRIVKGEKPRLTSIPGSVPDPFSTPPGCPFHPRCKHAMAGICDVACPPPLADVAEGHLTACYLFDACCAGNHHARRERP